MLKTFSLFNLLSLLVVAMLGACNNNANSSADEQISIAQALGKETVDSNIIDFIEVFSTDTNFQLNRIKFPLKIKRYIHESGSDSIIYLQRADHEMMDFRRHGAERHNGQPERRIIIDKDNSTAIVELRGIDNGLMVDYLFERINGYWMLIEVHDRST